MRVLIIEDNRQLAEKMREGLASEGFMVDVAHTGSEGEGKVVKVDYDAVLLDLNLPDKDGLEVLKTLRRYGNDIPVIVVTARAEVSQRALGLDLGADDYLTKPFKLLELRARLQAVIRRSQGRTNPVITIGKLNVDPRSRTVTFGKAPITLKAKEFDILEYLAIKHPNVVSMEDLGMHVYDLDFDPASSVLRVHVARLKKALADASGVELLRNIRGKGYVLCEEI
ncbi:MAG: response regulator transcription factor [Propionibacteriaceae bacterium]|jgi:DNA-binding response OmpR family regulator|nr:response regulator transcription factor [Propionibacteriaceae bacterium]